MKDTLLNGTAGHWSLFSRMGHVNEFNCFSSLKTSIWSGALSLTSQIHDQAVTAQISGRGGISLDSSTQRLLVGSSQRGVSAVPPASPGLWEVHRPRKSVGETSPFSAPLSQAGALKTQDLRFRGTSGGLWSNPCSKWGQHRLVS